MTEQTETETDFWAAERAQDAANRGHHADPGACGTCKAATGAGGQVEHDECAKRATLLPAPDAPGYELITGMSEEEVWALPARFHTPVFLDTCEPKAWVCAVCWGDGWNTQWPCKAAQAHGTQVFTPEHEAETTAKRQAAELAELESRAARYRTAWRRARTRALAAGSAADRYAAWNRSGQTALQGALEALLIMQMERDAAQTRVTELDAQLAEMTRLRDNALRALHRDDVETDIDLEETIAAPFYGPGWDWDEADLQRVVSEAANAVRPAFGKLTQQRDELRARVAELERKYVGAEPTIAEEMAYLSRCIDTVLDLCTKAEEQASRWEQPLPAPEWVAPVRAAAEGLVERTTYPPALPWARLMDADDLEGLLADLADAASGDDDLTTLEEVEAAIGRWRAIAEAQHAHNTAPGPDAPKDGEGQ
ncbi:hypothetical protein ACWEQ7_04135 [Streptomyces sp. NPDC004069]